jgi:hypothetical protein
MGVVTGIPMEFQFGTNWAAFSRQTGGVIGQTLAMEGVFSFFLESSFLGLFLFGEKRLGPRLHWVAAHGLQQLLLLCRQTVDTWRGGRPVGPCRAISMRLRSSGVPMPEDTIMRYGQNLLPGGDRRPAAVGLSGLYC